MTRRHEYEYVKCSMQIHIRYEKRLRRDADIVSSYEGERKYELKEAPGQKKPFWLREGALREWEQHCTPKFLIFFFMKLAY